MKEIPEGLVKPDNITEEAFKKWFNYFLQTFDSGYEPQSVPDSIANGDLTPDNGYAVADLFCMVLDLWTYDSALCCRFVPRFVPCVEAIIAKETFAFIADEGKQYEDFFIIYERFGKSLDSVRRYIQDFNEELLEPVHTWKTQSRFKQRPKKKVVKLHPILAGFTKQGKR